jgi:hypothetical protein
MTFCPQSLGLAFDSTRGLTLSTGKKRRLIWHCPPNDALTPLR